MNVGLFSLRAALRRCLTENGRGGKREVGEKATPGLMGAPAPQQPLGSPVEQRDLG
jgi:hypothetical protein